MARRVMKRRKTRKTVRRQRRTVRTGRLAIPRNIVAGTRYKEIFLSEVQQLLSDANNQFFVPLYNLFVIPQGNFFNERTGPAVYFHKIQFQISIFPDIQNTAIFENDENLSLPSSLLEDPRCRVIMVNQKRMASKMPIDGTTGGPTWPYYSNTINGNYAQSLTLPIDPANDSGMIGKVDDRNYMVRSDNMYNLLQNTAYPIINIDQTVALREQYSYPYDPNASVADYVLNDTTLWYKVPQVWVYLPQMANATAAKWKVKLYMKVVYDSL